MEHEATYSPEDDKIRITPAYRLNPEDYAKVKSAGYRWAPMQKLFFAVWSPAAEDIAIEMCGEIDDEDKSLVERSEERAERFEDYSEARKADADRAHAAVHAIADGIPPGQPILVGHHSERHARRDAEKIENGMRKAVSMWKTSQYWKDRAEGALRHAKYKERPDVRARRIKTLEADLRQQIARYTPCVTKDRPNPMYIMQQKWSDCYPHGGTSLTREERDAVPEKKHVWTGPSGRGGQWTAVEDLAGIEAGSERYREHLMNRLEYEYGMLGKQIGADSFSQRFDYAIGGKITISRESAALTILKLNKKDDQTVSVSTNSKRWTRIVPVEDILTYEPPAEGAAEQIKAATKRSGPCNYPGDGFATCTKAEWAKINKDYKSTIHRIAATDTHAAHCVRWAFGVYLKRPPMPEGLSTSAQDSWKMNEQHSYYSVYITDEKRKDPPSKDAQPAQPDVPALEHIAPTQADIDRLRERNEAREAEKLESAKFDALQDTLKAGVQVVSANQLFPTPPGLAERIAELAEIQNGMRVLEPSNGTGNLAHAAFNAAPVSIVTIEISLRVSQMFTSRYHSWGNSRIDARCCDFLECNPSLCEEHQPCDSDLGTFDRVLMNPPFENGADIKHILHALTFLKPGGRLVAICANGPRQNDKLKPLADHWEELPAGTFEGTNVRAVLMVINKPAPQPERSDLCENAEEARQKIRQKIAGGRSWPALKETKVFDAERLSVSPLFKIGGLFE